MTATRCTANIASMSRGRPRAAWQRCRLQAGRADHLGHNDVYRTVKRQVAGVLHSTGRLLGGHQRFAEIVLRQVADITNPKILELGSDRRCLSRKLLDNHPRAEVTITDVDPIVEVPDV
jgi:hypothetical protein